MSSRILAVLIVLAASGLAPAKAATMFCCTDDHGRRTCGDTLPQICYGRAYTEIIDGNPREVPAPLTADQKVKRDADAKAKREAERAAQLERRQNQALLDSYTSVQDIDFMRDRALAGINRELTKAQDQLNEAIKRKQELARQAAPYKTTPMPDELSSQIRATEDELAGQQRVIESKQQEMEGIRARFEAQKQRYIELTKKPLRELAGEKPAKN